MEARFLPALTATGVGSLPHQDLTRAVNLITDILPDTPFWPQLPKYSPLENMITQVSPGLPFLNVDEEKGTIFFAHERQIASELEKVYRAYLEKDNSAYSLPSRYIAGLEEMIKHLQTSSAPLKFFKGQMAGPITLGLAAKDKEGRDLVHNEVIFDALYKALILRGCWLIQRMKEVKARIIFFLDEPALAGLGSAFFTISPEVIRRTWAEVIAAWQAQGALVGIHCCGNTDWSLLLESKADIINFDAWSFWERLALYLDSLIDFLERGGILAWGIVPTAEFSGTETWEIIMTRLEREMGELVQKGLNKKKLYEQSLLTPSCGMGLMEEKNAEKALGLLGELSKQMRRKYVA